MDLLPRRSKLGESQRLRGNFRTKLVKNHPGFFLVHLEIPSWRHPGGESEPFKSCAVRPVAGFGLPAVANVPRGTSGHLFHVERSCGPNCLETGRHMPGKKW